MSEQLQFAQFAFDPIAALDALIHETLWGSKASTMPAKARQLLMILRWHKGTANARPLGSIAETLKTTEREVKQHAKTLTEEFGIPIGASRQQPHGYYLCVTAEDYAAACRPYIHEVQSLVRRLHALHPTPRLSEILGQLQLELDAEKEGK